METTFYLNIRKGSDKGIIYFVFSHMSIKTRISSKIKLNKSEWNNGYPLQKNTTKAVRNTLDNYKGQIDDFIGSCIKDKKRSPTHNELQEFISNLINGIDNNKGRKTISHYAKVFLEDKRTCNKPLKPGTLRYKKIHLDHFVASNSQYLTVMDLSKELLAKYKKKLYNQRLEVSTINNYIKTIISFLNWLSAEEISVINMNGWLKKDTEEEKPVIALTEQELIKLEMTNDLPDHLQKQLDIFLVMCYTTMDISTLRTVTKNDIIEDAIHIRRIKTAQPIIIPMLPEVKILLEKYDYKLPFISDNKHNEELKEVFKKLELNRMVKITKQTTDGLLDEYKPLHEVISSHKGRKTAITTALGKGAHLPVVMKITGHKKLQTMQKYINFSDGILANELQKMSRAKKED